MNKLILAFFALSPILLGYVFNISLFIPIIGSILFWILPFVQLLYWCWVGKKFAMHTNNPIIAIVLGNIFGAISLLVYFWQFVMLIDTNRNLWLSGFSQMFSCSLSPISSKLVIMLQLNNNSITQTLVNSVQIVGFLLMIFAFSIGYIHGKRELFDKKKKTGFM
jgi:hypothetical protein